MGDKYPTVKVIPHSLNVVWHEGFTEPLIEPGIYKVVPVDALVIEKMDCDSERIRIAARSLYESHSGRIQGWEALTEGEQRWYVESVRTVLKALTKGSG